MVYRAERRAGLRESAVERSVVSRMNRDVYRENLEAAHAAKEQVAANQSATPEEREAAELDVEFAQDALKTFELRHDYTGALKKERFNELLDQTVAERDPARRDSVFEIRPRDLETHLLSVKMGELDRLNKLGHDMGDEGLTYTFDAVQAKIEEILRETMPEDAMRARAYDIGRVDTNFMVILRSVPPETAARIREAINDERGIDISDAVANRPAEHPEWKDAIPITASSVSLAEAMNALNDVVKEGTVEFGIRDEKALLAAALDIAQAKNDALMTRRRIERITEKLEAEKPDEAERLYGEFLGKYLKTEFGDYGSFVRSYAEKTKDGTWESTVRDASVNQAMSFLREKRGKEEDARRAIGDVVIKTVLDRIEGMGARTEAAETKLTGRDEQAAAIYVPARKTRGAEAIAALEAEAERAKTDTAPNADRKARNAAQMLDKERALRDPHTGLYGRGEFFRSLDAAFREDRPMTVVSIDMAFLKYFDMEGGKKTGDEAIAKAAEILDRVAAEASARGVAVEAYRTGGDEFAMSAATSDPEFIRSILESVQRTAVESGYIPPQEAKRSGYGAERLQFNLGTRSADGRAAFRSFLEESGIRVDAPAGSPEELELLKDLQVRLADKQTEIQKAFNRFQFLLERRASIDVEAADATPEERAQLDREYDTLVAYSSKALFGEPARLKAWNERRARGELDDAALDREVFEFIRSKFDLLNREEHEFRTNLDLRIELEVVRSYYESRVSDLEREIAALDRSNAEHRGTIAQLEERVKSMQGEVQAIVDLRSKIRGTETPVRDAAE